MESIYGSQHDFLDYIVNRSFKDMSAAEIEYAKDIALKYLDDETDSHLIKAFKKLNSNEMDVETFELILTGVLTVQNKDLQIGQHGTKGGFETAVLWEINLQLNSIMSHKKLLQQNINASDPSIELHFKDDKDVKKELAELEDVENSIRVMFGHIEDYLIAEEEEPHHLPDPIKFEDGETFEYRIDSNGKLYYKADS